MLRIKEEVCIGCEMCKDGCPVEAIDFQNGVCKINTELCIGCENCVEVCPMSAVEEVDEDEPEPPVEDMNDGEYLDYLLKSGQ